jgi:hypothetical protein
VVAVGGHRPGERGRFGRRARLVVGNDQTAGPGVGEPVQTGAAHDAGPLIAPDQSLLGPAAVGVEQGAGDGVVAKRVGHGLDAVALRGEQRDGAALAGLGALLLGLLRAPVVGVDDDDLRAFAEHVQVRGLPEVEDGAGGLAVVLLPAELRRATGREQLAGAAGGQRAAGDGVGVVLLGGHLIDAAGELARLGCGGHEAALPSRRSV